MVPDDAPLLMFFYGTLKRGQRNHEAYCRGATWVSEATVRGRLYDLPAGYPALVVPEDDVRAVGTADPSRDAAEGRHHQAGGAPTSDGSDVFGELFAFDDPGRRLPALDLLEGFTPGEPSSPYRRALIPALTEDGTVRLAWTYVVTGALGRHLPAGRWPSGV